MPRRSASYLSSHAETTGEPHPPTHAKTTGEPLLSFAARATIFIISIANLFIIITIISTAVATQNTIITRAQHHQITASSRPIPPMC